VWYPQPKNPVGGKWEKEYISINTKLEVIRNTV
jgi:hypothetical protein